MLPGIAEVTVADGKVAVRASEVFLIDRQLKIPSVETNRLLTRYTKTVENFPTGFTLDVHIEGEDAKRTVPIHGADMKNMVAAATDVMHWLKSLRGKGDA